MSRKLLAILSALLIAASLFACNESEEKETTGNEINISSEETGSENEETGTNEIGSEIGSGNQNEDKTPGDYEYEENNDKVYVLHENGAVNLRNADNSIFKSLSNGTELQRLGVSAEGGWSKVEYEGSVYYIVTDCVTALEDVDGGFTEVSKTLVLNTVALTIRIAPSMDNRAVGYYSEGDEVKVIAENTTTGWYKVEFTAYDGTTAYGFVASNSKYYAEQTTEDASANSTEAATEAATESATEAATTGEGK